MVLNGRWRAIPPPTIPLTCIAIREGSLIAPLYQRHNMALSPRGVHAVRDVAAAGCMVDPDGNCPECQKILRIIGAWTKAFLCLSVEGA